MTNALTIICRGHYSIAPAFHGFLSLISPARLKAAIDNAIGHDR